MRRFKACIISLLLTATSAYAQTDPANFATVINVPPSMVAPNQSIGSNTQLNVFDGGYLGYWFNAGSPDGTSENVEVNVSGGLVGDRFTARAGSTINISGGEVESSFRSELGSIVNISGGTVGGAFAGSFGGAVNISGGTVGSRASSSDGSIINLSGGTIGDRFGNGGTLNMTGGVVGDEFRAGGIMNIAGGRVGHEFEVALPSIFPFIGAQSDVQLIGGEFHLNGAPYTEPTITLGGTDYFSGTLQDGSVFIFSRADCTLSGCDSLTNVRLTTVGLPALDSTSWVVDSPNDEVPNGLRQGQSLVLRTGGELGQYFGAFYANLQVEGGVVGKGLEVEGTTVSISEGTIGSDFHVYSGSTINVTGGTILPRMRAFSDTTVNVSGGEIGVGFHAGSPDIADSNVTVNLSGGSLGGFVDLYSGSQLNVTGGTVGNVDAYAGSTVNLSEGVIGGEFDALSGSTVKVSGGSLYLFTARSGSNVEISGGAFGYRFHAFAESNVTISGGTFARDFNNSLASNLQLKGGEFQLNGLPYTESVVTLADKDVLTGTLLDGSVFIFSPLSSDNLNEVQLVTDKLPPIDSTPIVIESTTDPVPRGLRQGQVLTLQGGGAIGDNFSAVNSTLVIAGGQIGNALEVSGTAVTVTSGAIGGGFTAYAGSNVEISGGEVASGIAFFSGSSLDLSSGTVGEFLRAHEGSFVTVSGGTIGKNFEALAGSVVNITGGSFGAALKAQAGSAVEISGGKFARDFNAYPDSVVRLLGGEFRLNGELPATSKVTLATGDVLTGTLQDGSVFVFSTLAGDSLFDVTLKEAELPSKDLTPIVLSTATDTPPQGLREGQTLYLQNAGRLGEGFASAGATLHISGGVAGAELELADTVVDIAGGSVGDRFYLYSGTEMSISGGSIGTGLRAGPGSAVTISGGVIGTGFSAMPGSHIDLQGGVIGQSFSAGTPPPSSRIVVNSEAAHDGVTPLESILAPTATVVVSDGIIGDYFAAYNNSSVVISGGTLGEYFTASGDTTVSVTGGTIGSNARVLRGGTMAITGGVIGDNMTVSDNSTVNISGGTIGAGFWVQDEGTVNISGGTIGSRFRAGGGGSTKVEANISGGTFGDEFRASFGSTVNISGGTFGRAFVIYGEVNLFGRDFLLDGVPVDGLSPGEAYSITERDATLSGFLADGSVFSFDLNSVNEPNADFISPLATLTVTLVPEPSAGILVLSFTFVVPVLRRH